MWSDGTGSATIRDLKYTIENPRHFVDSMHQKPVNGERCHAGAPVNRGWPLHCLRANGEVRTLFLFAAIIEHVRDGSMVRALLLPDYYLVTVMLSGIKVSFPMGAGFLAALLLVCSCGGLGWAGGRGCALAEVGGIFIGSSQLRFDGLLAHFLLGCALQGQHMAQLVCAPLHPSFALNITCHGRAHSVAAGANIALNLLLGQCPAFASASVQVDLFWIPAACSCPWSSCLGLLLREPHGLV